MSEKVLKCPMCGRLYNFYNMMVGDQSVCPRCRKEAKDNMEEDTGKKQPLFPKDQ